MFCLFYMFPVKLPESGRAVLGVYEAPSLGHDKGPDTVSSTDCNLLLKSMYPCVAF